MSGTGQKKVDEVIHGVYNGETAIRKARVGQRNYEPRVEEEEGEEEEEGMKKLDVHLQFFLMRDWRRVCSGMSLSLQSHFSIFKYQK